MLMGDFNSPLARSQAGFVGRWCIHTRQDSGGDRLLEIMKNFSLRAVSTCFQPRRGHSNATFLNIQPGKAPSQIDYILVSSRWSTGARDCKTQWGLSIAVHGRKYDHALIAMNFKIRLKCDRKRPRKDFTSLRDEVIKENHNKAVDTELDKSEPPDTASGKLRRLNEAMRSAQSSLPTVQTNPNRKWETSQTTMLLVEQRKQTWDNIDADARKRLRREISRSARNDYRNHIESIVVQMENANAVGNSK